MRNSKRYSVEELKQLIADDRLDLFYNSRAWRQLARDVKQAQNNECQRCKARGRYAQASIVHHAQHLREHPDLAYSKCYLDERGNKQKQLIALCFACHEEVHGRMFKGNTGKRSGYTNEEQF